MAIEQITEPKLEIMTQRLQLQPGLTLDLTSALGQKQVAPYTYVNESPCIHINCMLSGIFRANTSTQKIDLPSGFINIGHADGEQFCVHHCQNISNVELMIEPDFLQQLSGNDYWPEKVQSETVFIHTRPSGAQIQMLAQQLKQSLSASDVSPLLVNSLALEYLHWTLEAFQPSPCNHQHINTREKKKITQARDYLIEDLSLPPTIPELSRRTGLNQFKLKQGFKAVYGTSIYAYFQRERMKAAQRLLREYNVTETAMILGYSNISHFSSAFQKQLGILPSALRNQPMAGYYNNRDTHGGDLDNF